MNECIACQKLLEDEGYSTGVVSVPRFKPLHKRSFVSAVESVNTIVLVEEHMVGALGSVIWNSVSEVFFEKKVIQFGCQSIPNIGGKQDFLIKSQGLDYYSMAKKVINEMKRKS